MKKPIELSFFAQVALGIGQLLRGEKDNDRYTNLARVGYKPEHTRNTSRTVVGGF